MAYPLGVRRDGSYYTRIEWASHTESDPTFWVANLIREMFVRGVSTRRIGEVLTPLLGIEHAQAPARLPPHRAPPLGRRRKPGGCAAGAPAVAGPMLR